MQYLRQPAKEDIQSKESVEKAVDCQKNWFFDPSR
jgi:hypothetical protein